MLIKKITYGQYFPSHLELHRVCVTMEAQVIAGVQNELRSKKCNTSADLLEIYLDVVWATK